MKILHIAPSQNEVLVMNYDHHQKMVLDFYGASLTLKPAFKIGEVAKLIGREADTIRKWEYKEWIPVQKQWQTSPKKSTRFYSQKDVEELRDMVSSIHVGRPRKDRRITNPIPSKGILNRFLKERMRTF